MRVFAISLALLAAALAAPTASAGVGVPVHVEFVQCVRAPCPPQVWCDPTQGGLVERDHDCSHRVSVDAIDCLWGEHWVEHKVGPVTVRYTVCNQPE